MTASPIQIDSEQIRRDLAAFSSKLAQYQTASRKSAVDVLRKKAGDLAIALSSPKKGGELRKIAPKKGFIRESNLDRMRSGGGLKISKGTRRSVYEKYGIVQDASTRRFLATGGRRGATYKRGPKAVNIGQLLANRELASRSSASGYLASGSRFPGVKSINPGETKITRNRAGGFVTDANLKESFNGAVATLFENASYPFLKGMTQPKARAAVSAAIRASIADMDVYLDRKQSEALKGAGLK